ncbi:unnamed protein product, partial [Amoebophrya sp. A25]|eukprot:GSA25T00022015001.1
MANRAEQGVVGPDANSSSEEDGKHDLPRLAADLSLLNRELLNEFYQFAAENPSGHRAGDIIEEALAETRGNSSIVDVHAARLRGGGFSGERAPSVYEVGGPLTNSSAWDDEDEGGLRANNFRRTLASNYLFGREQKKTPVYSTLNGTNGNGINGTNANRKKNSTTPEDLFRASFAASFPHMTEEQLSELRPSMWKEANENFDPERSLFRRWRAESVKSSEKLEAQRLLLFQLDIQRRQEIEHSNFAGPGGNAGLVLGDGEGDGNEEIFQGLSSTRGLDSPLAARKESLLFPGVEGSTTVDQEDDMPPPPLDDMYALGTQAMQAQQEQQQERHQAQLSPRTAGAIAVSHFPSGDVLFGDDDVGAPKVQFTLAQMRDHMNGMLASPSKPLPDIDALESHYIFGSKNTALDGQQGSPVQVTTRELRSELTDAPYHAFGNMNYAAEVALQAELLKSPLMTKMASATVSDELLKKAAPEKYTPADWVYADFLDALDNGKPIDGLFTEFMAQPHEDPKAEERRSRRESKAAAEQLTEWHSQGVHETKSVPRASSAAARNKDAKTDGAGITADGTSAGTATLPLGPDDAPTVVSGIAFARDSYATKAKAALMGTSAATKGDQLVPGFPATSKQQRFVNLKVKQEGEQADLVVEEGPIVLEAAHPGSKERQEMLHDHHPVPREPRVHPRAHPRIHPKKEGESAPPPGAPAGTTISEASSAVIAAPGGTDSNTDGQAVVEGEEGGTSETSVAPGDSLAPPPTGGGAASTIDNTNLDMLASNLLGKRGGLKATKKRASLRPSDLSLLPADLFKKGEEAKAGQREAQEKEEGRNNTSSSAGTATSGTTSATATTTFPAPPLFMVESKSPSSAIDDDHLSLVEDPTLLFGYSSVGGSPSTGLATPVLFASSPSLATMLKNPEMNGESVGEIGRAYNLEDVNAEAPSSFSGGGSISGIYSNTKESTLANALLLGIASTNRSNNCRSGTSNSGTSSRNGSGKGATPVASPVTSTALVPLPQSQGTKTASFGSVEKPDWWWGTSGKGCRMVNQASVEAVLPSVDTLLVEKRQKDEIATGRGAWNMLDRILIGPESDKTAAPKPKTPDETGVLIPQTISGEEEANFLVEAEHQRSEGRTSTGRASLSSGGTSATRDGGSSKSGLLVDEVVPVVVAETPQSSLYGGEGEAMEEEDAAQENLNINTLLVHLEQGQDSSSLAEDETDNASIYAGSASSGSRFAFYAAALESPRGHDEAFSLDGSLMLDASLAGTWNVMSGAQSDGGAGPKKVNSSSRTWEMSQDVEHDGREVNRDGEEKELTFSRRGEEDVAAVAEEESEAVSIFSLSSSVRGGAHSLSSSTQIAAKGVEDEPDPHDGGFTPAAEVKVASTGPPRAGPPIARPEGEAYAQQQALGYDTDEDAFFIPSSDSGIDGAYNTAESLANVLATSSDRNVSIIMKEDAASVYAAESVVVESVVVGGSDPRIVMA